MTWRAVILGVGLGLFVAGFTYFNDHVIRQTYLINHHLPASVFGFGLLLLLAVNPLLRPLSARAPFRAAEIGVILALGLAVCGWPGMTFFRSFTHYVALPATQLPISPAWQAVEVMSYVPGGSPRLAEGQVADWRAFVDRLATAGRDPAANPAVHCLWSRLDKDGRRAALDVAQSGAADAEARRALISAVNHALEDPELGDAAGPDAGEADPVLARRRVLHANRRWLDETFAGIIRSPPAGEGVLLLNGEFDPSVVGPLVSGSGEAGGVPWRAWWPTIRLWGGTALCVSAAVLCLMLVVYPQWSQRELLPFPVVRFVEEIAQRDPPRALPDIFSNRLFWATFAGVCGLYLVNGLQAWFPHLPHIPLTFDFSSLGQVLPYAQRVDGFNVLMRPTLFFSAIGFGLLISTQASLSVGISAVAWVLMAAVALRWGVTVMSGPYVMTNEGPALRFGAYLGMALMVFYFGRRYYGQVIRAAVGLPRGAETPAYAPWACRGMVVAGAGAVLVLHRYAGLDPLLGVALVVMVLVASLVLARLNAEIGLFYAQPDWYAAAILMGFLGIEGLGPGPFIVVMLGSILLTPGPREGMSPFLLNGLRLFDRVGGASAAPSAALIGGMVAAGFIVALVATLTIQYRYGLDAQDPWPAINARKLFDQVSTGTLDLSSTGELAEASARSGLDYWRNARVNLDVAMLVSIGLALVLAMNLARMWLPSWPIHPVLFVVWGSYPSRNFAASFLLAAVIKWAVIYVGGERGYHVIKPAIIGLIAGELLAILFWSMVGASYYFATGAMPATFHILPP